MNFSEYWSRFAAGCVAVFRGVVAFVQATAPVAEAVGTATGNAEVVAAAKIAGSVAEVAEAATDENPTEPEK